MIWHLGLFMEVWFTTLFAASLFLHIQGIVQLFCTSFYSILFVKILSVRLSMWSFVNSSSQFQVDFDHLSISLLSQCAFGLLSISSLMEGYLVIGLRTLSIVSVLNRPKGLLAHLLRPNTIWSPNTTFGNLTCGTPPTLISIDLSVRAPAGTPPSVPRSLLKLFTTHQPPHSKHRQSPSDQVRSVAPSLGNYKLSPFLPF